MVKEAWSKELTEPNDFDYPISELLFWRQRYGLEALVASRRRLDAPFFPPGLWRECTPKTQEQAEVYTKYITDNCCDDRAYNYYPLLDRIVEWMDIFYGDKTATI